MRVLRQQAEDRQCDRGLARARLADDPEGPARAGVAAQIPHRTDVAVPGAERHVQAPDLQQGGHRCTRWVGSSASRRPSPMKLTVRIVSTRSPAGKKNSQGSVVAASWPLAIRLPRDTSGGWMPRPRKDSTASMRIASATVRVALTMIGPIAFGIMCRKMI